jgi:hypothetical protein
MVAVREVVVDDGGGGKTTTFVEVDLLFLNSLIV